MAQETAPAGAPATRNTIQRSLVLDTVRSMHCHPTSAEVYEEVRKHHANISRATVYRNLHLLADRGDILCVENPGGADRYDFTVEPHYHLLCTECGRAFDAPMDFMDNLEDRLGDTGGFAVTGHTVIFQGICPECLKKN